MADILAGVLFLAPLLLVFAWREYSPSTFESVDRYLTDLFERYL